VVESDVLDRVAQQFLYAAAADTPGNGASKKRPFHNSEPSILASDQEFERGPAVPGEQVELYKFALFFSIYFCVGCSKSV